MSKQCNLKKQPAGTVCNPLTGRWIKIGGDVYNKLVSSGHLSSQSAQRRTRTSRTTEPIQRRTRTSEPIQRRTRVSEPKMITGIDTLGFPFVGVNPKYKSEPKPKPKTKTKPKGSIWKETPSIMGIDEFGLSYEVVNHEPEPKDKPIKKTATSKPKVKSVRKAPDISATVVPVGTEMQGEDGEWYVVALRPKNNAQYWAKCSFKTSNCKNK